MMSEPMITCPFSPLARRGHSQGQPHPQSRASDPNLKSIVELINEVKGMDSLEFAERFEPASLDMAYYRRIDFDNWLRRCVEPGRRFVDIKEAWDHYEKSFG